jgi:hypothetical protein
MLDVRVISPQHRKVLLQPCATNKGVCAINKGVISPQHRDAALAIGLIDVRFLAVTSPVGRTSFYFSAAANAIGLIDVRIPLLNSQSLIL